MLDEVVGQPSTKFYVFEPEMAVSIESTLFYLGMKIARTYDSGKSFGHVDHVSSVYE